MKKQFIILFVFLSFTVITMSKPKVIKPNEIKYNSEAFNQILENTREERRQNAENANLQLARKYVNYGIRQDTLGYHIRAIADFTMAISYDPNYADAYYFRARAKSENGDQPGAIADYNIALNIDPNDGYSFFGRGVAKFELGDKYGACADWSKAGELGITDAYNKIKFNCK